MVMLPGGYCQAWNSVTVWAGQFVCIKLPEQFVSHTMSYCTQARYLDGIFEGKRLHMIHSVSQCTSVDALILE